VVESNGEVVWEDLKGKEHRGHVDTTEVAFFYGVPELGQNLHWKPLDYNLSLPLSYLQKVKTFYKPQRVPMR
jgi:hypothetical protein